MCRCCVVPTCMKYKGRRFIRIPYKNKDLFNIWLQNINNPKLFTMEPKNVYKSYRICTRHFEKKWFQPETYAGIAILKIGAIPTIFLTKEEEIEETLKEKKNKIITSNSEKQEKFTCSEKPNPCSASPKIGTEILANEIILIDNLSDINTIKEYEKNLVEIPESHRETTAEIIQEVNSDNFLSILTSPFTRNHPNNEDLIKKSISISKHLKSSTSVPECGKLVQLHMSHTSFDIFGITLRKPNL